MADKPVDPSVIVEVAAHARPIRATVIYRQVLEQRGAQLWEPSLAPARWNAGFLALYASLTLDVAIAERIKRRLGVPTRLIVGLAETMVGRVVDLRAPEALAALGLSEEDFVADDYRLTQRLGIAFVRTGVAGLFVPAAIRATAALYPRFRFVRDRRAEIRATPPSGTNLVIYPDNLVRGDAYREIERFACMIQALSASLPGH